MKSRGDEDKMEIVDGKGYIEQVKQLNNPMDDVFYMKRVL